MSPTDATLDAPFAPARAAAARLATRLAFFAAGFALACWAPLVPYAKANVGAGEGTFGLLLLCLGIGSVVAMPLTGWLSARMGSRPMILLGGFGMALMLPLLPLLSQPVLLGAVLALFGAALGTTDVAMNVHALEVEKRESRPLMSGFHAMFSLGGIAGAGGVTLLLSQGAAPALAAALGGAITLAAIALAAPRLLAVGGDPGASFVLPRGVVVLLALLAAVMFLMEGAVLDWGALLLLERDLFQPAQAGLGFLVFSITMTLGRLTGDRTIAALGARRVLVAGGLAAVAGNVLLLTGPGPALALTGFALVGLGAANIVPVLFSAAGRQRAMPAGMAVAAVTTTGYAGVLLGPAAIGFVAEATSLPFAFWMLAALILLVPLSAAAATRT
jgi:predicted MFS family arabinose efflux permease